MKFSVSKGLGKRPKKAAPKAVKKKNVQTKQERLEKYVRLYKTWFPDNKKLAAIPLAAYTKEEIDELTGQKQAESESDEEEGGNVGAIEEEESLHFGDDDSSDSDSDSKEPGAENKLDFCSKELQKRLDIPMDDRTEIEKKLAEIDLTYRRADKFPLLQTTARAEMMKAVTAYDSIRQGNFHITIQDFARTIDPRWLNDQVINIHLDILCSHFDGTTGIGPMMYLHTTFYDKLKNEGLQSMKTYAHKWKLGACSKVITF